MDVSTNRKRKRDIQESEMDMDCSFTVDGCGFSTGMSLKKRRKSFPRVRMINMVRKVYNTLIRQVPDLLSPVFVCHIKTVHSEVGN